MLWLQSLTIGFLRSQVQLWREVKDQSSKVTNWCKNLHLSNLWKWKKIGWKMSASTGWYTATSRDKTHKLWSKRVFNKLTASNYCKKGQSEPNRKNSLLLNRRRCWIMSRPIRMTMGTTPTWLCFSVAVMGTMTSELISTCCSSCTNSYSSMRWESRKSFVIWLRLLWCLIEAPHISLLEFSHRIRTVTS